MYDNTMEENVKRAYDSHSSLNEKILKGADILADNVSATLGPKGRNVILQEKDKAPFITKDGVTVAAFVQLEDPFENLGAQIIKQASSVTNTTAGDGTTTATVLARAILKNSQKYLAAGASPTEMKRGIDKAVTKLVESLKDIATPIRSQEDIEHVATISANGDKTIGQLIATAVDEAGKDGAITIEEARSVETSLELIEGFQFDSGYLSNSFITDERRAVMRYDNPLILTTDYSISNVEDIMPVLQIVSRENRPLVIIAENIEGQALAALIMNTTRGTMKVAAIKAPSYGEERRNTLQDLALATGATFVTRENNIALKDVKLVDLGVAKSIESQKNWTAVVGGTGNYTEIEKKIDLLKQVIKQTENMQEAEAIQRRITRLASGVAIIRVGGTTEVEMIEKKHRIEDALEAVKSAQEEGIVPGGGTALLRASKNLEVDCDNQDQEYGVKVLLESITAPVRQMAFNAGLSEDIILQKVQSLETFEGYNFSTDEVCNLMDSGIIDPCKVTRCAVQNAASAASTLITTNHAIVQLK